MHFYSKFLVLTVFCATFFSCTSIDKSSGEIVKSNTGAEFDVAAIIWPAYQNEPRWKELGIFGDGVGEWQNVYEAKPKFKGHNEPRKSLWGYVMDDNPNEMARQIDAALASGVNVFIYDWYWYEGKPFLENALNNGFLKAKNCERMKFFLMWANHDVNYLWNNKIAKKDVNPPLYNARVSLKDFKEVLVPRFIEYFKKPNHYQINGKPVFSIYHFPTFLDGVGGEANGKEAIAYLDKECKKVGFNGVYLIVFGRLDNNVKVASIKNDKKAAMDYFGVSALTTYNWNYGTWNDIQKGNLKYTQWFDMAQKMWEKLHSETKGNFFPNVTVGWDTNSRYPANVLDPRVDGSNPKDFEKALRTAKEWSLKNAKTPRLITINSWNEWTEGSYLMPDEEFGYGYLNAIWNVFGKK